jgi:predicted DCC family thiol-disulfide oxidoreductase YuxK
MKPLRDNILLYDAECPMCQLYSNGFIGMGMLDKNGRADYSKASSEICQLIDKDRARNEIALVDLKNGSVKYGMYSLFAIIEHSFPIFKGLFSFRLFQWIVKRVYSFISFNRRVIISGNNPENPTACNPDYNLSYRIAYLVFSIVVSCSILKHFSPLLGAFWPIPQGWAVEILLVTGQLVFQTLAVVVLGFYRNSEKLLNYLANVMTVSLMGSLLLIPALIVSWLIPTMVVYFYLAYFGLVVAVMFFEHKRRVKVYHLPWQLSYTWVLYRVLVSGLCIWIFN